MIERNVVILFGGSSEERRVSVASAQHVSAILEQARTWFLEPEGAVSVCPRPHLLAHSDAFVTDFRVPAPVNRWPSLAAALDSSDARDHLFFLALHGGEGEDGSVQRELEKRAMAFTGSGSQASALGFDKVEAKRKASAAGIRVVESQTLPQGNETQIFAALKHFLAQHGRLVAKPIRGGSSVGLHHVRTVEEALAAAKAMVREPSNGYLAEAFVSGTELTVGVVDEQGKTRALPCSEVRVDEGRAFDYEGKYLGKGSKELTPAQVPPEVSQAAQALAVIAHRALGCEGYSRTDLIVDSRGPVFLELNTLPGLTRASFLPQQLAAEGSEMRGFLQGQLELALARREALRKSRRD